MYLKYSHLNDERKYFIYTTFFNKNNNPKKHLKNG